jgi:hypothetical protein
MLRHRKATTMKKKHFCEQEVFGFIWDEANEDGMWEGDDSAIAAEFNTTDDEAYSVLSELTERNRLQRVGSDTYIIMGWPERDEPGEE